MTGVSHEEQRERILSALSTEQSSLRDSGVEMMTEFLLERRVGELVDVEATVSLTLGTLTADNVTRVVAEHLSPAWDRHRLRADESSETVGDGLPPAVKRKVEEIALIQSAPPAPWAKGAVDPALVRELLAPVLQDTLLSFAKKLSASAVSGDDGGLGPADGAEGDDPGVGGRGGGIAGRLRKSAKARAEKLASVGKTVGKSVAGRVGAELDKRMATTAREFSRGALRELREAFGERLRSEEGRALVGQIQKQIIHRVFETEVSVLMRDIESLPRRDLEALLGPSFEHNAARTIGRRAVAEEVRAFLDSEGDKTIRALADEAGVLAEARAAALGTMDGLSRELFRSPAFASWFGDVLAT